MTAIAALPGTETLAFALRLRAGASAETYRERHAALWPEMRAALLGAGILHYEIHLHAQTGLLFAFMIRRQDHAMDRLPDHPAWQRWQAHMSDLLEGPPARIALAPMFVLAAGAPG